MKNFLKVFAAIFFIFTVFSAYAFSGRKILFDGIAWYLKSKNIVLQIGGADDDFEKIQKISCALPDGSELICSDVLLNQKKWFGKFSIEIGNLYFKGKGSINEEKIKESLSSKIKNFSNVLGMLRKSVSKIEVSRGNLELRGKNYELSDFSYKNDPDGDGNDYLDITLKDNAKIHATLLWKNGKCELGNVDFKNLFQFNGNLAFRDLQKSRVHFNLMSENDEIKIIAEGNCEHIDQSINVPHVEIQKNKKSLTGSGKILLNEMTASFVSEFDPKIFLAYENLPDEILKNFQSLSARTDISLNFQENFSITSDIKLKKKEKNVGNICCIYADEKLNVNGDVNWIELYGYRPKKFSLELIDENLNGKIIGEDFEINTSGRLVNSELRLSQLELICAGGFLRSVSPIEFSKNSSYEFEFDFSSFDFFKKLIPIKGSGKGNFVFENQKLSKLDAHFVELKFRDNQLSNLNILINEKDIFVQALFNEKLLLNISGEFSIGENQIAFSNLFTKLGQTKFTFNKCELNIPEKNYCVEFFVSNNDQKNSGHVSAKIDEQEIKAKISSLQLNEFAELFGQNFYNCVIDGDLNLKSQNEIFLGEGSFSIFGFVSSRNQISGKCNFEKEGLNLDVNLKNTSEHITLQLFFPMLITKGGVVTKNPITDSLNCKIIGDISLETFLQLPDKTDIRGDLNCDLKLSGTTVAPVLSGNVDLRNVNIIADNLTLKNGKLLFIAQGDRLVVSKAEFTDYRKNRLTASGDLKLFFDELIPNFQTNLKLYLANFQLFDSDNLKIRINGNGAVTGTLDNLLISGKVDVPYCKYHYFSYSDDDNEDIKFENEKYVSLQKSSNDKGTENSFLNYDIQMKCPRIDCVSEAFDIVLAGDLRLGTFAGEPTLQGALKLVRGNLHMFDKRMKFGKGKVIFYKEYPFNPEVAFTSSKNFGDLSVRLKIYNSPRDGFSFNLTSDPPYSQEIILSKILFGKDLQSLSVTEAAQLAHTISGFKERRGIFSLVNAFQKIGIVDTISVANQNSEFSQTLYSDTQNSSGNRMHLKAGKYIHDNVFVSVSNDDEGAFFDVDMSVSPKFFVKASSRGQAGISWKYRY